MPELPDVEIFRRRFAEYAEGRRIEQLRVRAPELLRGVSARQLASIGKGRTVTATSRHGKNLFARMGDEGWLILHFGMTGDLEVFDREEPKWTRLRIDLDQGVRIAFVDMRKFGRIGFTESPDDFVKSARLGPDALGLSLRGFRESLAGRRGAIKPALLDQRVIAGIGNLYADEMLFATKIHPSTPIASLEGAQIEALHRAMKRILDKAIEVKVDFDRLPRSWLLPSRERTGRCPRCKAVLKTATVGGRTSYFCPREQKVRR